MFCVCVCTCVLFRHLSRIAIIGNLLFRAALNECPLSVAVIKNTQFHVATAIGCNVQLRVCILGYDNTQLQFTHTVCILCRNSSLLVVLSMSRLLQ